MNNVEKNCSESYLTVTLFLNHIQCHVTLERRCSQLLMVQSLLLSLTSVVSFFFCSEHTNSGESKYCCMSGLSSSSSRTQIDVSADSPLILCYLLIHVVNVQHSVFFLFLKSHMSICTLAILSEWVHSCTCSDIWVCKYSM